MHESNWIIMNWTGCEHRRKRSSGRTTINGRHCRADPAADAPIERASPGDEDAGPLEMAPDVAIRLALANRLDLRTSIGEVYDAQRKVVVAADALRAELTLLGDRQIGERRNIDSASLSDAQLRFDEGQYGALLALDLPFERTAERNAYRESFIALEAAVRDVQELEDQIKLSIRNALRTLKTARESIKIQAQSVILPKSGSAVSIGS